jgi:hypothetical protein
VKGSSKFFSLISGFSRSFSAIPGESVTEEKKGKRKKSFRAEKRKEKIGKEETQKQAGKYG